MINLNEKLLISANDEETVETVDANETLASYLAEQTLKKTDAGYPAITPLFFDITISTDELPTKSVSSETWTIQSADDLTLTATYFTPENSTDKWVILVHGYSNNQKYMYHYVDSYLESGFNVLTIDQRAAGDSEGEYLTLGAAESQDVSLWTKKIVENNPNAQITLHGVSMGAATIMLTAARDDCENVTSIVEDCGYPSAYQLISGMLYYGLGYSSTLMPYINEAAKDLTGYYITDATAIDSISAVTVPSIFISGTNDSLISPEMTHALYTSSGASIKSEMYIENAAHARSAVVDSDTYYSTVLNFVGSVDTLTYSQDNSSISGSNFTDKIISNGSNVTINSAGGNDYISISGSNNLVVIEKDYTTIEGFNSDDTINFADGLKDKVVDFEDDGLTFYTDTVMSPDADYVHVKFTDISDTTLINLQYGNESTEKVVFINDDSIYSVAGSGEAQEYIGATANKNHGVTFHGIDSDLNIMLDSENDSLEFWNVHSIIGGDGNTTITGSDDDDTIIVGLGDTTINASGGTDYIVTNGNHTTYINGDEVTTLYSSTFKSVDGELQDLNSFFYDGDEFNAIMYTADIILGDGYLTIKNQPRITLSEDTVSGTFAAINNTAYGWSGQAGGNVDVLESGIANSESIAAQNLILFGIAPYGLSTLTGGNADDTIYAGGGDLVKLSRGKDFIVIDNIQRDRGNTDQTTIEIMTAVSSNSTVDNYQFGTDAITVKNQNAIKFKNVNDDLQISYGNYSTLTVKDTNDIILNDTKIRFSNNLTYDSEIDYYGSNNSNTLSVIANNSDDTISIWLDGSDGKTYKNISNVNAGKFNGMSTLAGDEHSNIITASKGNSSLWGGTSVSDDTLIGADGYNEFFYLKGNGNDEIQNVNSDDLVNLFNISLDDISDINFKGLSIEINFNDGGSLKTTSLDDVTFKFSDGTKWKSDKLNKTFESAD